MSTLNVKVPDEMDEDIDTFLEDHPHYLNKSEFVRDAVRHLLKEPQLSEQAREDIRVSREQIDSGDVVSLDDLE
ncbi:ribbon-helix-helix domain-containing protein [Halodesulfurarchaeum sp. HSR-GB]|uniref:ribbon-helix-helix domain-containing protein n=1 Tax=Halodesulfurarchaeum sp. HSR-GB TaxID=3074077 RepID=UPI002855D065|nr:ribbon-helix-helix domain-containing protein [Halodesulfurarchaeum sp. HSR-GB]MDR5656983.1 ribbon-helix-helix domain-containing protein [Halodesulfurarchaeum sp. HSR-GB]